jgi:uncharacterized membrane protein
MILMALDHVRMYFALGTWYAEPTDLATTTPLLFFARWITHFCAPVFVFLAGTSAFLYGIKKYNLKETASFLFTRGLWLVFVELVIVNFAWTLDITYSFRILQVIWAIGISMIALSGLVFLPTIWIFTIGLVLVFGHNLLDTITVRGTNLQDLVWYTLHQPGTVFVGGSLVNFVYPVLPWVGLMALGYVFGTLYKNDFPAEQRQRWLLRVGIAVTLLFILLRAINGYGEPREWDVHTSPVFTLLSFLNTTKYPPSLHFLLMTIGPSLIFLSLVERYSNRLPAPVTVFGRVPFFFYILHLYVIHALAMLLLVYEGRDPGEYILSSSALRSGSLIDFGISLGAVYVIWVVVILLLFPLCKWYQRHRETHPSQWWLRYL